MRANEMTPQTLTMPLQLEDISIMSEDFEPGAEIGSYVVDKMLGTGGYGTVYAATHRQLGHRAAIKILHAPLMGSARNLQRFVHEAESIRELDHPNIIRVYEAGRLEDGRPYSVMELHEGGTLSSFVRTQGRLPAVEVLAILEQICGALSTAHRAGIVHRDVKASNVLIGDRDGQRVIKLIDFGIARLPRNQRSSHWLTTGMHPGTPLAMAPEQIRGGRVDNRTDIYALGVLLFFALTGTYPFSGQNRDLLWHHLHDSPPLASALVPVSPAIDAVLQRCMAKVPEQRFSDVEALLRAFRAGVLGEEQHTAMARRCRALGVCMGVSMAGALELDAEIFDTIDGLMCMIKERLADAGFIPILDTTSRLLAARILCAETPAEELTERRKALCDVMDFYEVMAGRSKAAHGLDLFLNLHVSEVTLDEGQDGPRILDGDIVNTEWVPEECRGITMTPAVVTGMVGIENLTDNMVRILASL